MLDRRSQDLEAAAILTLLSVHLLAPIRAAIRRLCLKVRVFNTSPDCVVVAHLVVLVVLLGWVPLATEVGDFHRRCVAALRQQLEVLRADLNAFRGYIAHVLVSVRIAVDAMVAHQSGSV